jgi:hypothetical protein
MIALRNKATGALIGHITESDLNILIKVLEEESSTDQDYYLDAATLDLIQEEDMYSAPAVAMLRNALGDQDGIDIVWSRD